MPSLTRRVAVLVIVALSSLTIPLTITGASLALPDIRTDLGADLAGTQWVVNGYNACFAAFLVFTGSLADVLGRRTVFGAGVALFAATGAASVLADDITVLILVRALGGIGAAAATIGGSAILAAAFHGPARARVFGLFGTMLGTGLAFGPTIAGLLVGTWGWRAVFAVPAAVAALVVVSIPVLPKAAGQAGRAIDWPGAALFTAALLLLIYALVEAPVRGFADPVILAALPGVVVLGAGFVLVERRRRDPLFALRLLANRRFTSLAVSAGSLMGILVPLLVYLPSYLITVVGLDPGQAGLWLLMLTTPTVALPPLGAALARRFPAVVVAGSVAVSGIGAVWLTTISPHSSVLQLLGPLICVGTGVGLSTGVLDGMAVNSVAADEMGTATGMFNTARLVTETVALAAAGTILAAVGNGQLTGAGFTTGLRLVCLALGGFAAVASVCAAVLFRRSAVAETSGDLLGERTRV